MPLSQLVVIADVPWLVLGDLPESSHHVPSLCVYLCVQSPLLLRTLVMLD